MMRAWHIGFAIVGVAWLAGGGPAASAEGPPSAAHSPQADSPAIAAALARIEKLHGTIQRNAVKEVVAVDLFECPATNADVEQLVAALPELVSLKLWAPTSTTGGPNGSRPLRI